MRYPHHLNIPDHEMALRLAASGPSQAQPRLCCKRVNYLDQHRRGTSRHDAGRRSSEAAAAVTSPGVSLLAGQSLAAAAVGGNCLLPLLVNPLLNS